MFGSILFELCFGDKLVKDISSRSSLVSKKQKH